MGWLKIIIKGIGKALVKVGLKKAIPGGFLIELGTTALDVGSDLAVGNGPGAAFSVTLAVVDLISGGAVDVVRKSSEEITAIVAAEMLKESTKDALKVSTVNIVSTTAKELLKSV